MNSALLFTIFSILTVVGLLKEENRHATFSRTGEEWIADIAGLIIQGIIIPAFPFMVVPILAHFFPGLNGKVELHVVLQFLLSFVVVDYIYYWNHRFFHRRSYWPVHRLHHSARFLDVFATSRNSLITSFLFVYVWSQIFAMYFLKDPE